MLIISYYLGPSIVFPPCRCSQLAARGILLPSSFAHALPSLPTFDARRRGRAHARARGNN